MPVPKSSTQQTPSLIATGVVIEGDVHNAGDLQLDGHINGNLSCESLVMGEAGRVDGQIDANHVTIRGKVLGEIRAEIVRLEKSAMVEGDVFHESLSVEAGARITGRFAHLSAEPARPPVSANDSTDETSDYLTPQSAAQ